MPGIPGKFGPRPMALHAFSLPHGFEILQPGAWGNRNGVPGQEWRCWEFGCDRTAMSWSGARTVNFWSELCRTMGAKPGPYFPAPDSYWASWVVSPDLFRVPGYASPKEDWSYTGQLWKRDGCERGFLDGKADGYAEGKKGKGQGKGKGMGMGKTDRLGVRQAEGKGMGARHVFLS